MSEENRDYSGELTRAILGEVVPANIQKHITKALDEAESRGEEQGATLAAFKLREIAETGEHAGTFGGPEIEKAAQAILKAATEAEKRGLKAGREEHKAGCMIAFEKGTKEMRERAALLADDFSWVLPLSGEIHVDNATDDAACAVSEQIGKAIRALPLGVSDSELNANASEPSLEGPKDGRE